MKKLFSFYPVIPVLVALWVFIQRFYIFKVMVHQNYVHYFGKSENFFAEAKFYFNYPYYFAGSVAICLIFILILILLGIKKPNYNKGIILAVMSVILYFLIDISSTGQGVLTAKFFEDLCEQGSEKSWDMIRQAEAEGYCNCSSCMIKYRENLPSSAK